MKNKLFRFGKGLIDGFAFGIPSAIKNAKASPDGGEGKHDNSKNFGYIAAIIIIGGVIFGALEIEEGETLFKMLSRFGFWAG